MWSSIKDWWVIDVTEPDAASRFFWRVFQMVWFGVWIASHLPAPRKEFQTDHGRFAVPDSVVSIDSALVVPRQECRLAAPPDLVICY
jgi:hypothetical protein